MGRKVFPPLSQGNMTDEEYEEYLHGEYYNYLLAGASRAKMSMQEALVILIVIAAICAVIVMVVR